MSPVFTARRRAEEFDSLVEGTSTGSWLRRRLRRVPRARRARSATMPAVTARPEFVADLREQLIARPPTTAAGRRCRGRGPAHRRRPHRRRRRERRLAAAVGGLAIVGATTSMAVASQSALPGDALYPLKRAIENAQTGVQRRRGRQGQDAARATPPAGSTRSTSSAAGRATTPTPIVRDPADLHRPGHRGLRPAARRLRRDRRRGLDRRAARLHRRQHGRRSPTSRRSSPRPRERR